MSGSGLDTQVQKRNGSAYENSVPQPTQNVNGKFSLNDAVEETRDLIAVHNVSEKNLLKTLKLGGFPAVSIAITKAEKGWRYFGNVSVVFGKESIDPEANPDNHVFGADGYTPVFPDIIKEKPYIDPFGRAPYGAFLGRDLTQELNDDIQNGISVADFVDKYRHDAAMMQAFHAETKDEVVPVVFESRRKHFNNKKYDTIEKIFVDVLGEEKAEKLFTVGNIGSAYEKLTSLEEDNIMNAVRKAGYDTAFGSDFDEMFLTQYIRGLQKPLDVTASERAIKQATNAQEYEKWLKSYADNAISGYFYSVRSDRALDVTADNAVSIMKEGELAGEDANVADPYIMLAREYGSIDAIRQDKERLNGRRRERDGSVQKQYGSILNAILHKNAVFDQYDQKKHSREIASVLRKSEGGSSTQQMEKLWEDLENATGLQISVEQVEELVSIRDAVWSAETPLFEAKPMRNMPLSEAKLVIVPEGTSQELLDALNANNIPVETYEAGNEQARLDLLNGATAQQYMFSLNDSFRTDQAIRKVLGKAVEQVHEEYADIDFSHIGEDTYSKFRKVIPELRKYVNGEVTEASAEKLNAAPVNTIDDVQEGC